MDLSAARLTVDEPDDLTRCNELFKCLDSYNFTYEDIVRIWVNEPEKLSSGIKRNEGAEMTKGYKMWSRAKKVFKEYASF